MTAPTAELIVHVERTAPGAVAVTVSGDLDVTSVQRLRDALEPVTAEGPESVVLDLTAVGFMDSIALAAIVHASRAIGGQDRMLIVVAPDSYARLILDATGLARCLNVVTARDAA